MSVNKGEIKKLSKKLASNPGSKFFIPLAEEYARAELYSEAIEVLKKGLAEHPEYLSGKVALGKVYMKKGMLEFAKTAFNDVLKQNPENLLCHRKLAILYLQTKKLSEARTSCDKVLALNPKDKEMLAIMESIQEQEIEFNNIQKNIEIDPKIIQTLPTSNSAIDDTSDPSSNSIAENNETSEDSKISVREYIDFPVDGDLDKKNITNDKALSINNPNDKNTIRRLHEAGGTVVPANQEAKKLTSFVENHIDPPAPKEYDSGEADRLKNKLTDKNDSSPVETEDISMMAKAIQEDDLSASKDSDFAYADDVGEENYHIATPSIAELYILQGDISKGIDLYKTIIKKDPDNKTLLKRLNDLIALEAPEVSEDPEVSEANSSIETVEVQTEDSKSKDESLIETSEESSDIIKSVAERKLDKLKALLNIVEKKWLKK